MSKKTVLRAMVILSGMLAGLLFTLSGGDVTLVEGAVAGKEGPWNGGHINSAQEGTGGSSRANHRFKKRHNLTPGTAWDTPTRPQRPGTALPV